jgi:hypothetical protein
VTGWEIMAEQMLLPIVITGFTELLELGVPLVGQTRPRASDVTVEMRSSQIHDVASDRNKHDRADRRLDIHPDRHRRVTLNC